ncbi:hypothetical protein [Streptomyces sp. NPDC058308]|uniref:hypothetical protein n=1 Tax=Streptomyces sp. NPDC058308 TaxID=3346440 RepID=UPI0036EEC1E1
MTLQPCCYYAGVSKLRFGLPLAVAAIFLVSSCGVEKTATVRVDDIAGKWVEPGGGSFTISADRTFKASSLKADAFVDDGCPAGDVSGTWGFYVDKSDALTEVSKKASSGAWIGLSFHGVPQGGCSIDLVAVDGGDTLCASDDPDDPCDLDVRFSRKP